MSTEKAESVLEQCAETYVKTGSAVTRLHLHRSCDLVPFAARIFGSRVEPVVGHPDVVSIKVPRLLNNENKN